MRAVQTTFTSQVRHATTLHSNFLILPISATHRLFTTTCVAHPASLAFFMFSKMLHIDNG
jgi:hypothetical protein